MIKNIEKIRFYPRFALVIRVIHVPFDLNAYRLLFYKNLFGGSTTFCVGFKIKFLI